MCVCVCVCVCACVRVCVCVLACLLCMLVGNVATSFVCGDTQDAGKPCRICSKYLESAYKTANKHQVEKLPY